MQEGFLPTGHLKHMMRRLIFSWRWPVVNHTFFRFLHILHS